MSDYYFQASMRRGEMADQLSTNTEQFIYVLSNALSDVTADEVIEYGQLGDEADPELVVGNLRMIADAIEAGEIR